MRWLLLVILGCSGEPEQGEPGPEPEPQPLLVCSEFGPMVEFPFPVEGELSPDVLEAWLPMNYQMWVSRRPDTGSPFGAMEQTGISIDRGGSNARLTGDQLQLLWLDFHFTEPAAVHEVRRESRSDNFPMLGRSFAPVANGMRTNPIAMDLTLDGLTLHYADARIGDVYSASRPDLDSPFGESVFFGSLGATHVSISADEHELYFDRSLTTNAFGIFRRVRTSRDESWTKEDLVSPVGSRPELSPDSTTLHFFDADNKRWTITRTCELH